MGPRKQRGADSKALQSVADSEGAARAAHRQTLSLRPCRTPSHYASRVPRTPKGPQTLELYLPDKILEFLFFRCFKLFNMAASALAERFLSRFKLCLIFLFVL